MAESSRRGLVALKSALRRNLLCTTATVTGLTEGIVPAAQSRALMDLCWKSWELDDAGKIGRAGAAT